MGDESGLKFINMLEPSLAGQPLLYVKGLAH